MTFEVERPSAPPRIETEEAVVTYLEEIVARVESSRMNCDVAPQSTAPFGALVQQREFTAYLVRHGHALGVCDGFLRAGLLSPVAYNAFVQRVRATGLTTLTGAV